MNLRKIFKINNLLVLLLILTIFLRFIYVDRFPVSLSHDEIEYTLSGISMAKVGTDISGYSFPINLFRTETAGVISAVPVMLFSFVFNYFGLSQGSARVFMVVINLLTGFVIYKLARVIFKNNLIGMLSAILFFINPWSMFLSRWAVDSSFALLFYLSGIYVFLRYGGWAKFISLVFLVLGFFSYHGAKPIFIPLSFILVMYAYFIAKIPDKLSLKQAVTYLTLSVLFFISYMYLDIVLPGQNSTSRSSDLIFSDQAGIAELVNNSRRQSISYPGLEYFENKIVYTGRLFIEKYLTAFSPDVLFLHGDPRATYRYENFGLFYFFELIAIVTGIYFLIKSKNKNPRILLLGLIIISPISTAISRVETSVVNRSFLMLPILVIIAAYGIYNLIRISGRYKTITSLVVFLAIFISLINFQVFYFFEHPVKAQENYFLSEKVLAKFINLHEGKTKINVITPSPREPFLEYIFYNQDLHNQVFLSELPQKHSNTNFQTSAVEYTDTCPEWFDDSVIYVVWGSGEYCGFNEATQFIQNQKDAGIIYSIYNSDLCSSFPQDAYRRQHLLSDYAIENMTLPEFCNRWIAKRL